MNAALVRTLVFAAVAATAIQSAGAQGARDRVTVLRAAAEALGMVRWSDIGAGTTRLPGIDVVNTMEFEGNATIEVAGRAARAQYHVALGYNPPAMRVTITPPGPDGASRRTIHTVRDGYAWDESELGAGLVPGRGTATPVSPAVARERQLQLWTLPYGVVKAALTAGEKTTVSTEGGTTVLTFPLGGALAGITVRATLDSNNLVTRVETQPDTPAAGGLARQIDYSDYADRGEVLTDIRSPGRIVQRQGGRTVLDVDVTAWEANNLYLVFPVPPNVGAAAPATSR